ncbi:MAG: polysaccharide deacetylase family protein [Firmicutes bacterium]|nr:polysaccharide deacetylase family protein [Bacillota bacterium]
MMFFISKRKLLLMTSIVLILAITMTVTHLYFPTYPRQVITTLVNLNRRVPIYCVQTDEKKIAISFDAAWGADHTDELLAILDEYNVKTTFFLVAFWLKKYPEVAARIAAAGHEIGNHSATHPHMNSLTAEQITFEVLSTHELIKEITQQEAKLFRPPFGEYNNLVIDTIEKLDYKVIQWSIDSLDWRPTTAADIVRRVTQKIEPGAIVLFHNNAEHTPAALRPILEFCRQEGYEIVPISELLLKGDYYIDKSNGMMRPR